MDGQQGGRQRPRGGGRMRSIMRLVLIGGVIMLVAFFYFRNSIGKAAFDYTSVPEKLQLTYIPADFKMKINEDEAIRVLSEPNKYRSEFDALVYSINTQILYHVATRMNLPDSLKNRIAGEYRKHHPYLRQMYFDDIMAVKDSTGTTAATWYENNANQAVDLLYEVASKYTCFMVNHVIITMLDASSGTLSVRGKKVDSPCGIALTEALRPMVQRLKERAAIKDYSKSRGLMQEKVEKVIAELATMEVRDKKGLNKELKTKLWGYKVSSTEVEITAISVLKVGFKLDRFSDIRVDPRNKEVIVTLPQPQILSHEVYPKVEKLDVGWLREVSNEDFNKNFNALREEFRRDAVNSDVMSKAKVQARDLMTTLLEPMVQGINKGYKMKVVFENDFNQQQQQPANPEFSGNAVGGASVGGALGNEIGY